MPHLFVDNLTVIDCSVLDNDRGLIGASWIVDIELFGELDKQSMVFDFGHIKKRIKKIIDDEVDHKLVIPTQYSGLTLNDNGENLELEFTDSRGQMIHHISPASAVCQLSTEKVSHNAVIDFLIEKITTELPSNVDGLNIRLHQEDDYAFYYCYSHGLKKHDGNCQRIAHGHRSRIEIWENDKRSRTWEQHWADLLSDIYIGSEEDIINTDEERTRFAYNADQGQFELELNTERVHFIQSDSTVECIAEHIANIIKSSHPDSNIRVKAFEGVKKGAIAIRK